jgi:hypothetical protein
LSEIFPRLFCVGLCHFDQFRLKDKHVGLIGPSLYLDKTSTAKIPQDRLHPPFTDPGCQRYPWNARPTDERILVGHISQVQQHQLMACRNVQAENNIDEVNGHYFAPIVALACCLWGEAQITRVVKLASPGGEVDDV